MARGAVSPLVRLALRGALVAPVAAAAAWGILRGPDLGPQLPRAGAAFAFVSPADMIRPNARSQAAARLASQPVQDAVAVTAYRSPLSPFPFAVKGLELQQRGEQRRAALSMQRALRLQPRSTAVRKWLLVEDLRAGRGGEAVAQAKMLYALRAEQIGPVSQLLALLALAPEGRNILKKELGGTPELLGVIAAAPAVGVSRQAALDLLSTYGPTVADKGVGSAVSSLVGRYLEAGDYVGARSVWERFLPPGHEPRGLVYDGTFRGLAGPPPFGWTLTRNQQVQAEIGPSGLRRSPGALQVRQFGRFAEVGARQVLLLRPGPYRLSYLLKAGGAGGGTRDTAFEWLLKCEKEGAPFARIQVPQGNPGAGGWRAIAHAFEVGASCPLQAIELRGTGTEAGESGIKLTEVAITPSS